MDTYAAFGLRIRSPIPLSNRPSGASPPDITFEFGPVQPAGPSPLPPDKWLEVRPEGVRLALEGIGHFLITPDDKVLIDPLPEAGTQDLLFALTGVVMGVVLGRRGKHVFHAGVVEIGGDLAETGAELGRVLAELLDDRGQAPDEHAAVPVVFAAGEIALGGGQVGLLLELLHFVNAFV